MNKKHFVLISILSKNKIVIIYLPSCYIYIFITFIFTLKSYLTNEGNFEKKTYYINFGKNSLNLILVFEQKPKLFF